MSWATFIWAVLIGACIATAVPQFLIWISQRRIVNLFFVILATAVVANLSGELALMRVSSVQQFARVLQWRYLGRFAEAARR